MKLGDDDQLKKLQREALAMEIQRSFDTEVRPNNEKAVWCVYVCVSGRFTF